MVIREIPKKSKPQYSYHELRCSCVDDNLRFLMFKNDKWEK